jgi:solute carrier family 25 (adenine nucleotide translocator) protein 4/5/6/31
VVPLIYPFDTVRRQMFTEADLAPAAKHFHGSLDCFLKIVDRDGVAGLYAGMGSEIFRGIGGALVIVAYDTLKPFFLT